MEELRKKIKEQRVRQGMSQVELAKKVGVSSRTIIHWEKGTRGMTVDNADEVLRGLGITYTLGIKN